MSLQEFAVLSGLYTPPETLQPLYTTAITMVDEAVTRAWWPQIGDGHFGSSARVSRIRDPLIRYLHRCIATSIAGRGKSQEWCTSQDLFFLYCILTGTPCDLARSLADYFATYYHRRERGRIYGGAYVTYIARRRGLIDPEPADMEAFHPLRLDRRTAFGMRIVQQFPEGLRFSTQRNVIWLPGPNDPFQGPAGQGQGQGQDQDEEQDQDQEQQQQGFEGPEEPPQHPRHIYRAVRLPAHVEETLQGIVQTQQQILQTVQQLSLTTQQVAYRVDRIEDMLRPRQYPPPPPPPP